MKRPLVFLACVLLIPVACGGATQPEATVAPPPTSTAAPTPTPDKCPEEAVQTFSQEMNKLHAEFQGMRRIAEATARINLSSRVSELQRIRNKMAELDHPECLEHCFQCELNGMEIEIEALLVFMADEPEWYVELYLREVDGTFALAQEGLSRVQSTGTAAYGECPAGQVESALGEVSQIASEVLSVLEKGPTLTPEQFTRLKAVEAPPCLADYVDKTILFLRRTRRLGECEAKYTKCGYEELDLTAHSRLVLWKVREAEAYLAAVR